MRVCIKCRMVRPSCSHDTFSITHKWRAPKKTNNKAWSLIAKGDYWWDKRHIDRTADKYIYHPLANGLEVAFGQADKFVRRRRAKRNTLENRLEIERRKKLLEERKRKFYGEDT